jgi:hypothetical protein
MSTPFWDQAPSVPTGPSYSSNPWDIVTIGGVRIPGIVELVPKGERRVDEKKHSGSDGETLTIHGRNPSKFDIRVRIWTADQLAKFDTILSAVWAKHGRTGSAGASSSPAAGAATGETTSSPSTASGVPVPTVADQLAFDISHPATRQHGINAVVVVELQGPAPGKVTGEKVYTLKCIEFMPATTKNAKPATVKHAKASATPALQSLAPGAKRQPAPDPSTNPSDTAPNFTPSVQNGAT